MTLRFKKTERGFNVADFEDEYNKSCSIQESSLADLLTPKHCIWLGIDGNRMHLTQEMVADLLTPLTCFVLTGYLPEGEDQEQ